MKASTAWGSFASPAVEAVTCIAPPLAASQNGGLSSLLIGNAKPNVPPLRPLAFDNCQGGGGGHGGQNTRSLDHTSSVASCALSQETFSPSALTITTASVVAVPCLSHAFSHSWIAPNRIKPMVSAIAAAPRATDSERVPGLGHAIVTTSRGSRNEKGGPSHLNMHPTDDVAS